MAGRPFLSIGEVLAALKPEFPDITVSKIRFLEAEGLITPTRTTSGYRTFYPNDLERLRTILKMQRESFLPLKVIRERLASLDAGTITSEQAIAPAPITIVPAAQPEPAAVSSADVIREEPDIDLAEPAQSAHFTESDLAGATGLDLAQVQALKDFGVICEHRQNGAPYFDASCECVRYEPYVLAPGLLDASAGVWMPELLASRPIWSDSLTPVGAGSSV